MFKCPKCGQTEDGFAVFGSIQVTWNTDSDGDCLGHDECDNFGDGWSRSSGIRCSSAKCLNVGTVGEFEDAADTAVRQQPIVESMDDRRTECANCDWTGAIEECNPIDDVLERVGAGEEFPVGECPKCTALTHYIRKPVLVLVDVDGGIIRELRQFRDLDQAKRAADELAKNSNYQKDDVRVFELHDGRYLEVYSPVMPGQEKA